MCDRNGRGLGYGFGEFVVEMFIFLFEDEKDVFCIV